MPLMRYTPYDTYFLRIPFHVTGSFDLNITHNNYFSI